MSSTSPLSQNLIDFIRQGTLQTFSKGEQILRGDTKPTGVFWIDSGYVKVYSITDSGQENVHSIYGPGAIFPIVWVITGKLRPVFYEALGPVCIYRCNREQFLAYLDQDIAACKDVLRVAVEMFNNYADRVDNLEQTLSSSRIIHRLIRLAEQHGEKQEKGILIKPPLKHHDIANSANCSRETVSRELARLEKKGLVSYKEQHIFIPDLQLLSKELHSN